MLYLLVASLLWSFSFGLIGRYLVDVDSNVVAFIRLSISFLLFLPFLRWRGVRLALVLKLMFLGAVQYGVMYMLYIRAYHYLAGYQVAMFTIFTPFFVAIIYDLMQRKFHADYLLAALLAVAGTAFIVWTQHDVGGALIGVLLVQVANVCFAFGQVGYKEVASGWGLGARGDGARGLGLGTGGENAPVEGVPLGWSARIHALGLRGVPSTCAGSFSERQGADKGMQGTGARGVAGGEGVGSVFGDVRLFGYMYLGAVLVTGAFCGATTELHDFSLSGVQVLVLIYLGVLPSGVAFFLWNVGAKRVNAGVLAVFNNLKIPLAIVVSLVVFGEKMKVDLLHLLIGGGAIIASLVFAKFQTANRR